MYIVRPHFSLHCFVVFIFGRRLADSINLCAQVSRVNVFLNNVVCCFFFTRHCIIFRKVLKTFSFVVAVPKAIKNISLIRLFIIVIGIFIRHGWGATNKGFRLCLYVNNLIKFWDSYFNGF